MTEWNRLRQQVLERDHYTCQRCFEEKKKIEIHHKIPRRSGGSDTLDNLITYCRKCHKTIEPSHIIQKLPILPKMTLIIKVSNTNHKRLSRVGETLDTMNDVIGKLLDFWESKHK